MDIHPDLSRTFGLRALMIAGLFASGLVAQCETSWLDGDAAPGLSGNVHSIVEWDADGAGPAQKVLVACGDIASYGVPSDVQWWNGRSWASLGTGVGSEGAVATSMVLLPDGGLVAGGNFGSIVAGGGYAFGIAKWNGSDWQRLGSGIVTGQVRALAVMANGDVIAAGTFASAGGVPCSNIARWDGALWSALGTGMTGFGAQVAALQVLPSGDLVAAGFFATAGGVSCENIARWDGAAWHAMGNGLVNDVTKLAVQSNGELLANGGREVVAGITYRQLLMRWDGTSWSRQSSSLERITALEVSPIGVIFAGVATYFDAGVSQWNGSAWQSLGAGFDGEAYALLHSAAGDLIAGGEFQDSATGVVYNRIARWDGASWATYGQGLTSRSSPIVHAVGQLANGDLIAAGQFQSAGNVALPGLARWHGDAWHEIGDSSGLPLVRDFLVLEGDELLVGGDGVGPNGTALARWDGQHWTPFAAGLRGGVQALAVMPDGAIIAGGWFSVAAGSLVRNIARWDGTTWTTLGTGLDGPAFSMLVLANGDLIVGGGFEQAGGVTCNGIARWDGSNWSSLGSGMSSLSPVRVATLSTLADGTLVAGGRFATAGGVPCNHIAQWHGTSWSPLGSGLAYSVNNASVSASVVQPNGDLVVGGFFTSAGGVPAENIARWDGVEWHALGEGANSTVASLALLSTGDLLAGGRFSQAGGGPSSLVARWSTSCPAKVASIPVACVGPAGPLALTAGAIPFVGGSYESTTTGFADHAIAFNVLGPPSLFVWFPTLLHCPLLVIPQHVEVLSPQAGVVDWQVHMPVSVSLAGAIVYQQSVQLAWPPYQGRLFTKSNGLRLQIGGY
ncbi:MAG: hypothetical protein ACI85K_001038 [Hyphomicrobiaceae bacterium]|jgi:hypothetical protein